MNKSKCMVAAIAIWLLVPAARAVDGVSFEYGDADSSNTRVHLYRIGVQWNWKEKLVAGSGWHVAGYWDLNLGYWDNQTTAKTNNSIADVGLTPVLRLQSDLAAGLSPYAELGLGFHFLSRTSVSTQRRLGSSFQFGDHVGVGARFGDKGRYDLGYRYQHLSNAGIKQPNQGINYHQLRLQYHF